MLTPQQYRELTKINSFKSCRDIIFCWGLIIGSLYLGHVSLFFLPIVILVISSRLHALTVMMHDGSHFLLHKNRKINDFISNFFCSFPLQISTDAYRQTHERHHQHTQTYNDPNFVIMRREEAWRFPKSKKEVRKILFKDLFLLTLKDHLIILKDWQVLSNFKKITLLEKILFPCFVLSTISLVTYFGAWREFVILQLASLFINPLVRIRAMSEHLHRQSEGQGKIPKLRETPTINANLLERFFISPFNTNRHLEHHMYPTVPYYNLEKVHALIKETTLYRDHCAFELDGYLMGKRNSLNLILSKSDNDVGEISEKVA